MNRAIRRGGCWAVMLLCQALLMPGALQAQEPSTAAALKRLITDMGYQNVVVEMSDEVTSIVADIDEPDVPTQVVALAIAGGVANPGVESIYVALTFEQVLIGYVEIPAKSLREAKETDDPTRLFHSWKFVALPRPDLGGDDSDSIDLDLDLGGTSAEPSVVGGRSHMLFPVADSHVYQYTYRNWHASNWGKYEVLAAGSNPIGGEKRSYLRFDVSRFPAERIKSARLRLYHYNTSGSNVLNVGVFPIAESWLEGEGTYPGQVDQPARQGEITWACKPSIEPNPIGKFRPDTEARKHIEIDITELVKTWARTGVNHGIALQRISVEGGRPQESMYGFYAREHDDEDKRPALLLEVEEPADSNPINQHTNTGSDSTNDDIGDHDDPPRPELTEAQKAYQLYIDAYNRLTRLMAAGKGNTPEAQAAYKAYVDAKKAYEESTRE